MARPRGASPVRTGARDRDQQHVNAGQLAALVQHTGVTPAIVQNRCYANLGWDRDVRDICRSHGIMYQGFSLLTANRFVLTHPTVMSIAQRLRVRPEPIVFRFARQAGMVPLTGTTSELHMKEDLRIDDVELTRDEVDRIESIAG